jgi:hypothetical protein
VAGANVGGATPIFLEDDNWVQNGK